jgi:hypothetical protein
LGWSPNECLAFGVDFPRQPPGLSLDDPEHCQNSDLMAGVVRDNSKLSFEQLRELPARPEPLHSLFAMIGAAVETRWPPRFRAQLVHFVCQAAHAIHHWIALVLQIIERAIPRGSVRYWQRYSVCRPWCTDIGGDWLTRSTEIPRSRQAQSPLRSRQK